MSGGMREKLGADLGARAKSGLVLVIAAALALGLGGGTTALLAALAGAAMGWEWRGVSLGRQESDGLGSAPLMAGLAGAALATWAFGPLAGIALLILGAGVGAFLDHRRGLDWRWGVLGASALGAALCAFVWLRGDEAAGLRTAVWLIAVVAATDIGAWAAGRLIGGPKLAPKISPKKTWAGLAGGVTAAAVVGALGSLWIPEGGAAGLAVFGALLAVAAQGGDLAESAFKRRFGVKDASALIPGHGGVMDRVDGLMAASLVLAVISAAFGAALGGGALS